MNEHNQSLKRPTGLLVVFILTVISTSLSILQALGSLMVGPPNKAALKEIQLQLAKSMKIAKEIDSPFFMDYIEKMGVITADTVENFVLYHSLSFIFCALGLIGAIMMFRGMKLGFHLYIVYSFLSLIQYYFITDPSNVPMVLLITNGLISLLFVFLYSRHLNWMKSNELEQVD